MTEQYDLLVIGGGPAGYVGAIRAAQLGMKVVCVEKRESLGGTCLNVGCIPSKALLHSSHLYDQAKNGLDKHGINVENVKLDLDKMLANKDENVKALTKGIEGLFAKNKIKYLNGTATIKSANKVNIALNGGEEQQIEAKNIMIATGSISANLPNVTVDEEKIVSSTGALNLKKVPENMLVIGGGYIGLEMGSVWSRLGAKVTVVEFADEIVTTMDIDIKKEFLKILKQQKLQFKLGNKVNKAELANDKVKVEVENVQTAQKENLEFDVALVAVGRKAYTDNLGLENLGINPNKFGQIEVNDKYQTKVANIYAVGDVIEGPMLAHKAEEEAIAAVENMNNLPGHVNYDAIPSVVYTHPEVASIGKTEQELKDNNISYNVGRFNFMANSRSRAIGELQGFVKILACSHSDQILGAHIVGPEAGNLIHEIAVGMEFKAASEDIAITCHAHPTLNEAVKEACLGVLKRTINS